MCKKLLPFCMACQVRGWAILTLSSSVRDNICNLVSCRWTGEKNTTARTGGIPMTAHLKGVITLIPTTHGGMRIGVDLQIPLCHQGTMRTGQETPVSCAPLVSSKTGVDTPIPHVVLDMMIKVTQLIPITLYVKIEAFLLISTILDMNPGVIPPNTEVDIAISMKKIPILARQGKRTSLS